MNMMFGVSHGSVLRASRSLAILLAATALFAAAGFVQPTAAGTLDRIKQSGKIMLGYRVDAQPFSSNDASGNPTGFTITLCSAIVEELKTSQALPDLAATWVPVKLGEESAAVSGGTVDLMCGADPVTLSSRASQSFSIPIFASGVGAIVRADSQPALRNVLEGKPSTGVYWRAQPARILSRKTLAVVAGSTDEKWLAERIGHFQLDTVTLPVDSYADGVKALTDGAADVFFGNRVVILNVAGQQLADGSLLALDRQFTNELVAIALARDNDDFRLIADAALSKLYDSSEFAGLYTKWFGAPGPNTLKIYSLVALPQ